MHERRKDTAFTRCPDRHQRMICSTSTSKQWRTASRVGLKGACRSHRHTQRQGCTVLMNAAARSVWTRRKSTADESWIRCPIDLSTFTHVTVDFLPHGLTISIPVTIILHVATLTFHARFPDFTLHICRERASERASEQARESLPPICTICAYFTALRIVFLMGWTAAVCLAQIIQLSPPTWEAPYNSWTSTCLWSKNSESSQTYKGFAHNKHCIYVL